MTVPNPATCAHLFEKRGDTWAAVDSQRRHPRSPGGKVDFPETEAERTFRELNGFERRLCIKPKRGATRRSNASYSLLFEELSRASPRSSRDPLKTELINTILAAPSENREGAKTRFLKELGLC